MKIVIINKSDATGGAAIVSRRLMEALHEAGADARMLVVEKLTDSPRVELAASPKTAKKPFMAERLKIFLANGLNRSTLFKIDTASDGLPLWRHPLVKEADAVLLNWVNQGMLSLRGVERILELGKPVIWTMHDMWCMTGVCHHAGDCRRYEQECGVCPLLGRMKGTNDISRKVWRAKNRLGQLPRKIVYVAVSRWLAGKAAESSLLARQRVEVIPNAFSLPAPDGEGPHGDKSGEDRLQEAKSGKGRIRILFGAARLDDPIKNLPALVEMTRVLASDYPALAQRLELVTFGNVKNPESVEGIAIAHRHLGRVNGEEALRRVYEEGEILVSSSSYETLPGTLVEAQAYGCVPVSFDRGGQRDITDHLKTGYIADYSEDPAEAGCRLAEGVAWAVGVVDDEAAFSEMRRAMRRNVEERFSAAAVAKAYLKLISEMRGDVKTHG